MIPRELFIPATISKIHTFDPGEVRKVVLTLPVTYEVEGRSFPVRDRMHPGSAFLARPFGQRSGKYRRRMYTRSNCAMEAPRILETIVNDTHQEKADTSPWWQTEALDEMVATGGTIDVRVDVDEQAGELVVYENSQKIQPNNLILEPDHEWHTMRILALAFSTGITPFLAHIRYMRTKGFGQSATCPGVEFTLVASVRNVRQLMEHEELLALARIAPEHFRYHPVLTREWPKGWEGMTGRIMQEEQGVGTDPQVTLDPLRALIPNLDQCHIRLCGNVSARDQLMRGLHQLDIHPRSVRAEVW
jgi:Oxidoreductase NAD-binding domain